MPGRGVTGKEGSLGSGVMEQGVTGQGVSWGKESWARGHRTGRSWDKVVTRQAVTGQGGHRAEVSLGKGSWGRVFMGQGLSLGRGHWERGSWGRGIPVIPPAS